MAQANTTAKKPTASLPKDIFQVDVPNHELLKLSYESYLANARKSSAVTKTRGEVRGGGKKPWRQKGTGRARFGSTRNPIWRTGGIVFGPRGIENYSKSVNKSAKKTALRQALTLANKAKKIITVDNSQIVKQGKTKELVEFLHKNKAGDRRVLMVVDEKTPELMRASNNLESTLVVSAMYLSVYHILNADKIVITSGALDKVKNWLGKDADKKAGK